MAQIFPTDFEEKLTIAQDDYILFSDSEDGNKIKKAQYSNLKGEKGDTGMAATITVGSTTTGAAGSSASVTNSGTSSAAVLDFTIPKGDKGDKGDTGNTGAAATISVGTTTTGDAGTSASVTNSGTSSAAVFNFTIPKGDKGDTGSTGAAATITAGTTTTLSPGSDATVTNSGTSSAAVFNFGIPQGATGATGNGIASITSSKAGKITTVTITETNSTVDTFQISDGADGQGSGDVIGPNSSVDGDIALFDGTTGKLIKDGSKKLSDYQEKLTTQTAYTTKGTASKVPTITTNTLGQVTAITETDISYPSQVDNTAYAASWDGDTTKAPSKNAVYDKFETLGTASTKDTGTSSGNVPVLDSNGKLNKTTLPGVALTDTFTVSTSSDLTSLSSAEQGDLAIATSENKTYVLSADPYSTAANWKEILSPTGGVTSVNSQTGAVTLDADDISDSTTTNKFVTATDKSTWSGKQDALTLPATPTQGNLVTWGANNKSLVDGGAIPTGVPSGGTDGQVLSKVSGNIAWANPSGGDVMVSSQSGNILTSGMKIWAGTEADYGNLGTYDSNTVYLTV